jgi:glutamine synthetase
MEMEFDPKPSLIRSDTAVSDAATGLLKLFGQEVEHVRSVVYIGQWYFLVDKGLYNKRADLVLAGRTLVGAPLPNGGDHAAYTRYYRGDDIKNISDIINNGNIHSLEFTPPPGLAVLRHEKPFAGVKGCCKYVNWSLRYGKGDNLFNPGDKENLPFLTLVASVAHAINRHGDLLRAASASAGSELLTEEDCAQSAAIGVSLGERLAKIFAVKEVRNGTSPVVFTGTDFEFGMFGVSANLSTAVTVINTVVAESIRIIGDKIKKELSKGGIETAAAVKNVLSAVIKESKQVFFDGNGNSSDRPPAHEALKAFVAPKAVELFERHKVLSKAELAALYDDRLKQYEKTLDIEIKTLTEIVNTQILPNAYDYQADIASGLEVLKVLADDMTIDMVDGALEDRKDMFEKLTAEIYYVRKNLKGLAAAVEKIRGMGSAGERAACLFNEARPQMDHIRRHVDALEANMPDKIWPLPKYKDMLCAL